MELNNPRKDEALLGIFLEEAHELLGTISAGLEAWASDLNNPAYLVDLKQEFHTLKGGARMVSQTELSELAHSLESLCDALLSVGELSEHNGYELMTQGCDQLRLLIGSLSTEHPAHASPQVETQAIIKKQPVVLVVDDSITIRTATQKFLARHDYTVITAEDGLEALEKLEQQKPDIILLDIEMPRMNGFQFAETIRKNSKFSNIPIIMITFCVGAAERKRAEQLLIERFMNKPYQEEELLEAIETLI